MSELVHAKRMVALVAPEFFSARIPRHDFKLTFGATFGTFTVDGLFGH